MGLLLGSNIGPALPVIVILLAIGVVLYVRRHRGKKPPNSNA
ncbi:hypothetical protein [Streptacidiphilus sp. MAP5-52]